MTMQRDVELRLRAHFEDRADRTVSDGQIPAILVLTAGLRQRPAWLVALRSPSMTDIAIARPTAPRALGLVAVLALLTAALVAAYLLAGSLPRPAPLNGQIVVGRMNEDLGDTEVFVMNPDGSNERAILPGRTIEGPFWSPDGRQLGLGNGVINADGTGFRAWDQSGLDFNLYCWDWSPDGQRMLCEVFADGDRDAELHGVVTVRASDGGDIRRLSMPGDGGVPGAYSPDGNWVAYMADGLDLQGSLFVVRVDGTERRQIGAVADAGVPRWSPDGKSLLVDVAERLASVDIATGEVEYIRIASQPAVQIFGGQWSPDGTRLLFKRIADDNVELYTMLADGTDVVRVTNTPAEERFFDWGPQPLDQ